ncbi:MAG: hypothetical protein M0R74_10425 [Dehalococcoidia bacterium]|nr:hypothetical protein [Dehalococcoidia bacterium]
MFSAFGEPQLTDDLGNAYALDRYNVGFSKQHETAPYRISNGTSAARFIGPIDPRATSLTLTGGAGGQLLDGDSVRFELSLSAA